MMDSKYIFVMDIMRDYLCAQTPGSHGLVQRLNSQDVCVL